ncbi:MAG: ornithine carbamoyltransferase [Pirellulales bacterium]
MQNLVTLFDLSPAEIEAIFAITKDLKTKYTDGLREAILPGRVAALLFEKPSLRTRVSFEAGMAHMGGSTLFLGEDVGFGKRESIADFGRVLSQYVDAIVIRSKQHDTVVELTRHSSCSVINGLTDLAHPCQALADLYTLSERCGSLVGQKLAWVGDANNVARSLAIGCAKVGMKFAVAVPEKYRFPSDFLNRLQDDVPNHQTTVTCDAKQAVCDAIAIYTDVWASMGQEKELEQRKLDFAAYQVNGELMSAAGPDTVFMHCLPAKRGLEVSGEVIDGSQSIVVEQAANRMHVQKGILAWLLGTKS